MLGEPENLIKAIQEQLKDSHPDMVFVIDILSVRFGGYFTNEIKDCLQKYRNLQMLTLNDCGIVSLENFPYLPNLIRLDMVFNEIKGEDLIHLKSSRHIQTLMLGANKIETIEQVEQLSFLKNLMQLDLINNPVYRLPLYREKMFQIFPKLVVLDTLDKVGKDAFNNVTMMETVSRVPDHLFARGNDQNLNFGLVINDQRVSLHKALARKGSLNHNHLPRKPPHQRKSTANISKNQTVFPVGRLKRMIKEKDTGGVRVSRKGAIFMAATLESLVAELLSTAGEEAKAHRKTRITPIFLMDAMKSNEELGKLLTNVTMGTNAI